MRDIEGAKAGSSQKKPYRAPVSATSTQRMRIKYGISEGTIRGFGGDASYDDMLKRIYLDGTPIMSAEGEKLLDVTVEFREGSQDQEPINGLPSITVEHDVNVEVKLAAPVSRSFSRPETTSFDIRISIPTLYEGNDAGDSNAGLVQFKIDISTDGGPFIEADRFDIREKILNGFSNTYNVPVTKGLNHVVRVSRLNSEIVSDMSVNKLLVDAIIEVTDVRLRYSNTAILYLEYDAEQFSNVPKLEMQIFGKNDILVPANYNTNTRIYATTGAGTTNGVWDGTWKRDYTDNPVWIALDLMLARRYGLGDKIDLTMINKWELYGLAQYCDESVADGAGGFEPRFTCNNMYMQKSEDAYKVLKDLAASFRAKVVWDGEFITLLADTPRDPVFTFSNANVKDITYSSTQDSAQRNLINVQYYDRNNKYSSDVVMQRSTSNVLARGKVVDGNFTALGCTSRGQAQRIASYVMNTELYETELVSFTTGLEGGLVRLNDVIMLADNSVAGQTVGGRIAAVDGRSITLDRPIPDNVQAVATTRLVINQTDVKTQPISVVSISDDRLVAVLADDPPAGTEAGLVWALLTQDLVPQKFTITDTEFNAEEMTFSISAIQYNESKYAAIDGSARIVVPPISIVDYAMLRAPTIVVATYLTRIVQDASVCDIDISWAQSLNAVQYQVEFQKEGGAWRIIGRVQALALTLDNMYTGLYTFRVCAYDSLGNASPYTYSDPLLVAGKVLPPPLLTAYSVVGVLFGYQHTWIYPAHTEDSRSVRLRFTTVSPVTTPVQEWQYLDIAYPTATFTEQDVSTGLRTWFSAAIVDKYGSVGPYTVWQSAIPATDPQQVLDLLDGQITGSQLDQGLIADIAKGNTALIAAANASAAVTAETAARITAVKGVADGLTAETTQRQAGDASNLLAINTYKTSNDAALAAVRTETQANTTTNASQATQLTNLTTSVNGKADATALTALTTRVTTAETTLTSQGTALTQVSAITASKISYLIVTNRNGGTIAGNLSRGLYNSQKVRLVSLSRGLNLIAWNSDGTYGSLQVFDTYTTPQPKATELAAAILALPANQVFSVIGSDNIGTNPNTNADLLAAITNIGGGADYVAKWTGTALPLFTGKRGAAPATCIQHMFNGVANNEAIYYVLDMVGGTPSGFAGAPTIDESKFASAAALTALDAKVTQDGANIASLSSAQTALTNRMTTVEGTVATKADAAALTSLTSRVTNAEASITAQSTQLTNLNSSLTTTNNNVTAAQTAATNAASLAGSKGKVIVQTAAPNTSDRLAQNLWIDITGNANTPKRWNGSAWVAVTDKVATDAAAAAASALAVANTKADASALTNLSTQVTVIDGKVNAQATQLTSLSTTVGNNTASITSQQTSIDGINAKATIQVAAGGTVGGVALGNNGGVVDMIIRADKFAIAPPVSAGAGDTGKYAFQYRATSTTLPNGTVVPAGMYLDNASIGFIDASKINATDLSAISADLGTIKVGTANIADAAITNAKIGNAAITTAKIGDLQVDTLKIKDNAVTVPLFLEDANMISYRYASGTFVIGEVTLTGIKQGERVMVQMYSQSANGSIVLRNADAGGYAFAYLFLNDVQQAVIRTGADSSYYESNNAEGGGGGGTTVVIGNAFVSFGTNPTVYAFVSPSDNPKITIKVNSTRWFYIVKDVPLVFTTIGLKK